MYDAVDDNEFDNDDDFFSNCVPFLPFRWDYRFGNNWDDLLNYTQYCGVWTCAWLEHSSR